MTERVPLKHDDISLGVPLPWTVFDQSGNLLLRRGAVVKDQAMLSRLLKRRPLRTSLGIDQRLRTGRAKERQTEVPLSPFEAIERLRLRCKQVFQQLRTGEQSGIEKCLALVVEVARQFDSAPDACIALVHLEGGEKDPVNHALSSVCLVHMLARRVGEADKPELLAAAMTANLGMLGYQERLNRQVGELTAEQLAMVRRHPEESVAILRSQGVNDRDWLQAVHQHHERSSGEGYPQGLKGEQIHLWARMLGMVDSYLGMVGKRSYHEPKTPQQALRYFLECGSVHDKELSASMIRALGVYPPGSCVRLANGEYAMVIRRNPKKPVCPEVRAIASADGGPYSVANSRNCSDTAFRICELVSTMPQLAVPLPSLWGY